MEAKPEERETEETGTGILEADIIGITFGLASRDEIVSLSRSDQRFLDFAETCFLHYRALIYIYIYFCCVFSN